MNIKNKKLLKKCLIISFVITLLIVSIVLLFNKTKKLSINVNDKNAAGNGACLNMSSELLEQIESGQVKLTYECFGANGQDTNNDYEAIQAAHKFANKEYIDKGIHLTVYGTSGSTYYMTSNSAGYINVATNTNWQGANFQIIDTADGIDYSKPIFRIVSPMKASKNGNGKLSMEYAAGTAVYNAANFTPSTTNASAFVNAVMNDVRSTDNQDYTRFFESSQILAVYLVDNDTTYYRNGSESSSIPKREQILINKNTGEILTDIEWNYNNLSKVYVWPIPETQIIVQNGKFNTKTYNHLTEADGTKRGYINRSIHVDTTGNVILYGITHTLDESEEYTNAYEQVGSGNAYYGFLRFSKASYIDVYNVTLTPHTFGKIVSGSSTSSKGTYDLTFEDSNSISFDTLLTPTELLTNPSKWGIMGTKGSKNIRFTNSRVNRIDAHEGIRNLYVADTVIGCRGMTLIGSGDFLGENLEVLDASELVWLRNDYGSTWKGNIVINGATFTPKITTASSGHGDDLKLIQSQYNSSLNYGLASYFPAVYMKNITIRNAPQDVYIMSLNDVSSPNTYPYRFWGGSANGYLRFYNITMENANGHKLYLLPDSFVNKAANLDTNSYRKNSNNDNNRLEVGYYQMNSSYFSHTSNSTLDNTLKTSTAFNMGGANKESTVNTVDNKVNNVRTNLNNKFNEFPSSYATRYSISNIKINNGNIPLNEQISDNRVSYSANIPTNTTSVSLQIIMKNTTNNNYYKNDCPTTVTTSSDSTVVNCHLIGTYGTRKNLTIRLNKQNNNDPNTAQIPTDSAYCLNPTYNGSSQTIVKSPGTGYTFDNTTGTNAQEYTITATLKNGYKWSDNTTGTKTITCRIGKATPVVTLSASSGQVTVGSSISFTESGKVAGSFKNNISNNKATVTPATTSQIASNETQTVTITGATAGTATISVGFYPTDSTNYSTVTKTYSVTIKNPDNQTAQIPTASDYCINPTYNGSIQSIIKSPGAGYTFDYTQGKTAKNYTITATLKSGYKWSDNSTNTKTVTCSIAKATPVVTISSSSGQVQVGKKINFIETSGVAGTFTNTAANNNVTLNPASITSVPAETGKYVEITGATAGSTQITITFEPTDKTNYTNTITKTYTATVIEEATEKQKVPKPTASVYCRELTYNGQTQTLTKAPGEGYGFFNNIGTAAKTYTVTAKLSSNYEWEDETSTDHTFTCSINKGTPSITYDVQSITTEESDEYILKVKSNIKGTFTNNIPNQSTAYISTGINSSTINANTYFTIIVAGKSEGTTSLETLFTPSDTSNWNTKSDSISIRVNKKQDNYLEVLSEQMRVVSDILYTGTESNPDKIEDYLSFDSNTNHQFKDDKLIIINQDTNDIKELELLNFNTKYKIVGKTIYIDEPVSVDKFKSNFTTNNLEIELFDGLDNLEPVKPDNEVPLSTKEGLMLDSNNAFVTAEAVQENVDENYSVGLSYQSNLLDLYDIQYTSAEVGPEPPVQPENPEEEEYENPATGSFLSAILLFIGLTMALYFFNISRKGPIHKI